MTKNTGTDYEVLTQEVFTRLHAQEGIIANVERNVILQGKSGTSHQIDVTFTLRAAGVIFRAIVQCKDWASAVKQEQLLALKQVLEDIPGQPRGIVVARSGFQEGARTFAEHHGILLYELREPRDEDWDGLIRTVEIHGRIRGPHFENVRLIPDEAAVRREMDARGLERLDLNFTSNPADSPTVFESGERCDLDAILNARVPKEGLEPVHVRHDFAEPVFVELPGSPVPRIRLEAIEATIRVTEYHQDIRVHIDHLVAYSFRDVLGGEIHFLGPNGGRVGSV